MSTPKSSPLADILRRVTRSNPPDHAEARVQIGPVLDRFLLPRRIASRGRTATDDGPLRWSAEDPEAPVRVELATFHMPFEFSVQDYLDASATRSAWQRLDRLPNPGRESLEAWDLYRTPRGSLRQLRALRFGNDIHILGIEHPAGDARAEDIATAANLSFQSGGTTSPADSPTGIDLHSGAWGYRAPLVLRNIQENRDLPEAIAFLAGADVPAETSGRAWNLLSPGSWTGIVTARIEPALGRSPEDWVEDAIRRTVPLCESLEGAVLQSAPRDTAFRVAWAQSAGRRRGLPVWCAWFARVREDRVFRTCMVSPAIHADTILWSANLWLWQQLGAGTFVEPPEVIEARLIREAAQRPTTSEETQTAFLRRSTDSQTVRLRKAATPGPDPVTPKPTPPEPPATTPTPASTSGNTQRFRRPSVSESTTIPVREESPSTQTQRFRRTPPPSEPS